MTAWLGRRAAAAALALGTAFAAAPSRTWIETRLGFDIDAGSGALEILMAGVPIVVGILLAAGIVVRRHAIRTRRGRATAGPER